MSASGVRERVYSRSGNRSVGWFYELVIRTLRVGQRHITTKIRFINWKDSAGRECRFRGLWKLEKLRQVIALAFPCLKYAACLRSSILLQTNDTKPRPKSATPDPRPKYRRGRSGPFAAFRNSRCTTTSTR